MDPDVADFIENVAITEMVDNYQATADEVRAAWKIFRSYPAPGSCTTESEFIDAIRNDAAAALMEVRE